jgi:hypothetical protein
MEDFNESVKASKDLLTDLRLTLYRIHGVDLKYLGDVCDILDRLNSATKETEKLEIELNSIHKQKKHNDMIKKYFSSDERFMHWMEYQTVVMTGEMDENGVLSLKALKNRYSSSQIKKIEIDLEA